MGIGISTTTNGPKGLIVKKEILVKLLKKNGFALERNGPHQKWSKGQACCFLPQSREINRLTAKGVLKQAGIEAQL
jgi:predicted RNA binding protein YcfA (HicA-like mRNA interferase family)